MKGLVLLNYMRMRMHYQDIIITKTIMLQTITGNTFTIIKK